MAASSDRSFMRYLDIEAEVVEDEQDEMDEDATGEMAEFLDDTPVRGEGEAIYLPSVPTNDSGLRRLETPDLEQIAESLVARYRNSSGLPSSPAIQRFPVLDNLYRVPVWNGHEKRAAEAVNFCIETAEHEGKQTFVFSAFHVENYAKHIFVVARSPNDIARISTNFNYISASVATIVPREDVVELERYQMRKTSDATASFSTPAWVRVRRGLYKHDLGLLVSLSSSRGVVYLAARFPFSNVTGGTLTKRRPSPALWSKDKLERAIAVAHTGRSGGKRVSIKCDGEVFSIKQFTFHHGLHRCTLPLAWLKPGAPSSVAEVSLFAEALLDSTFPFKNAVLDALRLLEEQESYTIGDRVKVMNGELAGKVGLVVEVGVHDLRIRCCDPEESYYLATTATRRCFRVGDRVKLNSSGRFAASIGQGTYLPGGIVVDVGDRSLTFVEEGTCNEVVAFSVEVDFASPLSWTVRHPDRGAFSDLDLPTTIGQRVEVLVGDHMGEIGFAQGWLNTMLRVKLAASPGTEIAVPSHQVRRAFVCADEVVLRDHQDRRHFQVIGVDRGKAVLVLRPQGGRDVVPHSDRLLTKSISEVDFCSPVHDPDILTAQSLDQRFEPNKSIVVIGGPFKGYRGKIHSLTREAVRVDLEARPGIQDARREDLGEIRDGRIINILSGEDVGPLSSAPTLSTAPVSPPTPPPLEPSGSTTPAWEVTPAVYRPSFIDKPNAIAIWLLLPEMAAVLDQCVIKCTIQSEGEFFGGLHDMHAVETLPVSRRGTVQPGDGEVVIRLGLTGKQSIPARYLRGWPASAAGQDAVVVSGAKVGWVVKLVKTKGSAKWRVQSSSGSGFSVESDSLMTIRV